MISWETLVLPPQRRISARIKPLPAIRISVHIKRDGGCLLAHTAEIHADVLGGGLPCDAFVFDLGPVADGGAGAVAGVEGADPGVGALLQDGSFISG